MAKAVLELEAITGNWDGGLRKAQTALQNFIATNGGLHGAIQKDSQLMADAIAKMGNMESKAKTASGRLREMEGMFMQLGDAYQQMSAKERSLDVGRRTIESMEKLKVQILDTKRNMQDLQGQISLSSGRGFGKAFAQGLVPGIGMGAGYVGAMAAVKAVGAMKDVVMDGIRVNAQFEQSNANLAAVLGKSSNEISALTENAKKLGASTLFTANQITELQTVLARRGLGEAQILQMTHGISNLALATGTGLADAAELAASTMQAFGMRATEMERIVSVLGVSTTKSALTTEKLGTALQYVAPTARAAGYSLEDTVAMLGKLVDSGLDASTAGTSLRQIILAMSTDNGKLARSFGRPVRGLQDFYEALEHVSNAEDLLSDASKEVRVTAVPALISLANNKDGVRELREELDELSGKLQKMADEQADTLTGKVTLLKSAWDGLLLSFGQTDGVLSKASGALAGVLNQMRDMVVLGHGTAEQQIAYYQKGASEEGFSDVVQEYKALGITEEKEIAKAAAAELAKLKKKSAETDAIIAELRHMDPRGEEYYAKINGHFGSAEERAGKNIYQLAAEQRDLIANFENVVATLGANVPKAGGGNGTVTTPTLSQKGKTPEEKAQEKIADALGAYESAINLATEEFKQDAIDSKSFLSKKQSAQERVYKAYYEAYELTGNEEYKKAMQEWIAKVVETASSQSELNNALKALSDKWKKEAADNKALVAADNSLYGQIKSSVGRTAWDRIAQSGGDISSRFAAMRVQLDGGVEIPDDVWTQFVQDLNEKLAELKLAPIQLNLDTNSVATMKNEAKETAQVWSLAAQSVSNIGSALQQIEDPSAKISGIVATAIASTALGFAQASASPATGALGIFGWIAASTAGLANMAAMIASIKSVTEYHANGDIVGNSIFTPRGTDTVPCMLTPREEVLPETSWRHQKNIGRYLQGSARQSGGGNAQPYVSGEHIWLGLNNYLQRTGRGELVTSRR